MRLLDIVENGEIDNKQLFIEVHNFFLVDGRNINRFSSLNDGRRIRNGFRPLNFIIPRMQILCNKGEIILIVLIEIS